MFLLSVLTHAPDSNDLRALRGAPWVTGASALSMRIARAAGGIEASAWL